MKINKGKNPEFVEVNYEVEFTKEEILSILAEYAVRKTQNNNLSFSNIQVVGFLDLETESSSELDKSIEEQLANNSKFTLQTVQMIGKEKIPINWKVPEKVVQTEPDQK